MDEDMDYGSCFALTARAAGEPSKLYTPVVMMNPEKLIVAKANAMWDTGAEVCIVSRKLAEALQLEIAPGPTAFGLTGSADVSVCYAYVSLVAGGGIVTVKCAVVDGHVGGADYSVIFGLNLIRRGSLAITGGEGGITLSFTMPPSEVIDFTQKSQSPAAIVPLSNGRENVKLYSGLDALKIIYHIVPKLG